MDHMGTYKTYGEKARWGIHKNGSRFPKQILEAKPHETATERLPVFYLTHY